MQAGSIPGDGHRLREWRLQSSQSRKLIANLQTAEGRELLNLEYMGDRKTIQISNIATMCFSVAVPLAETTQHRDTHH